MGLSLLCQFRYHSNRFSWWVGQPHKYRIDYTQEWVMRLCNPRVCGYPEAKRGISANKWVIAHNTRVGVLYHIAHAYNLRYVAT